ncbi:MAG TPA: hypothetical protein VF932_06350 [Anaerolineae bacterium]
MGFRNNDEKRRIERAVRGLLDTAEITALTNELQKRLRERSGNPPGRDGPGKNRVDAGVEAD